MTNINLFSTIQSQGTNNNRPQAGRERKMIGTYNTIDFDELLNDLQSEIARIRATYRVHSKGRPDKIADYNHMTTALLILKGIETE